AFSLASQLAKAVPTAPGATKTAAPWRTRMAAFRVTSPMVPPPLRPEPAVIEVMSPPATLTWFWPVVHGEDGLSPRATLTSLWRLVMQPVIVWGVACKSPANAAVARRTPTDRIAPTRTAPLIFELNFIAATP